MLNGMPAQQKVLTVSDRVITITSPVQAGQAEVLSVRLRKIQRISDKRREMFKKLIDNKKLGGVNCIIWKDGQVIYQESHGYRNLETL